MTTTSIQLVIRHNSTHKSNVACMVDVNVLCSYAGEGVIDMPLHQVAELVKDVESSHIWEKFLVVCCFHEFY